MLTTDDFQDDMEVETEANVYEPFDEYVKQVEIQYLKYVFSTENGQLNISSTQADEYIRNFFVLLFSLNRFIKCD